MTQFLMAEPLAEEAGEKRLLSLIYFNIGHLYYSQNLNTQADSTYRLAAQIGEKDPVLQASVLTQRGLIQMEKGEASYPEAEKNDIKSTQHCGKFTQHTIERKRIHLTMPTIQLDGKRRESYRIRQTESWRTSEPRHMLQSFRTTWKRILPNITIRFSPLLSTESPAYKALCHQSQYIYVSGRYSQRARRLGYFLRDGTQVFSLLE